MLDMNARVEDYEFTAKVRPLFDDQGNALSAQIGRCVYRTDTGEALGIAGPNFAPVQHRDVLTPILDHLHGEGYELQDRPKDKRSLYDLAGHKGAFIQRAFADNGAVMRTDIITGDFIQPSGATAYLDDGPDTMLWKISCFNSHDGSLAVRAVTSYERLVCLNGMTSPDFTSRVYGKHTANFNFDALKAKLQNSLNGMTGDAETFGLWAKTKITIAEAEAVLKLTVAKMANKPNGEKHFSQPLVNKILEQFSKEESSVWGLFQAVTHWQSHGEAKANAEPLRTLVGREAQVARMLKAREWLQLTA